MSVTQIIRSAIPAGLPYKVSRQKTGIDGTHILRVITPAWKSLPVYQRVLKVTDVLYGKLPPKERAKIFRVSVLTEAEMKRLQGGSPARRTVKRQVRRPSAAAA